MALAVAVGLLIVVGVALALAARGPASSSSTTGSVPSPTPPSGSLPGGATPLSVPSSEPQLHGGDIGQIRTITVHGAPMELTLVAVVEPEEPLHGPLPTDGFSSGPWVVAEVSLYNPNRVAIPFAMVEGGHLQSDLLAFDVEMGPTVEIGSDDQVSTPVGPAIDEAKPLGPGATRTGWVVDPIRTLPPMSTQAPLPAEPTAFGASYNSFLAGSPVTWALP